MRSDKSLLWDGVANSIGGRLDLLMESGLWVTTPAQVGENDAGEPFAYSDSVHVVYASQVHCGHLLLRTVGPPMWAQTLHRNELCDALTLIRERRSREKSVAIPTLCFWLIHKHNLGRGSHPHTRAPIRWKWSLCLSATAFLISSVSVVPLPSLVHQPSPLKFKKFHREIITELERKTDMDVKYMTVSSFTVDSPLFRNSNI